MDITLIKNAQHQINGNERRRDQHGLIAERILICLGSARVDSLNGGRQTDGFRCGVNRVNGVAERNTRLQVEGERYGGEQALMSDGQRSNFRSEAGEGAERHLLTGR